MALANDMTTLLNKISRRLGLVPIEAHLPEFANRNAWVEIIQTDTLVTFSRFFPYKFKMAINEDTCFKKKDEFGTMWYYIKDELLEGVKLLGISDIDWTDNSSNNASLTTGSIGQFYYPTMGCLPSAFESILSLQMNADTSSLYNRGISIDFQYPNRFSLKGIGNTNYDLSDFVVKLLVEHSNISTISPTKMNTFEDLAAADIAQFLFQNLKYWDGLNTAFVEVDMKLSELNDVANTRKDIIEKMENANVSMANDEVPAIWTV